MTIRDVQTELGNLGWTIDEYYAIDEYTGLTDPDPFQIQATWRHGNGTRTVLMIEDTGDGFAHGLDASGYDAGRAETNIFMDDDVATAFGVWLEYRKGLRC